MELKDLTGERLLSGVEESTIKNEWSWGEDCNVVMFIIDGITYKAIEDPDDGYRSHCKDLEITDEKIRNTFEPQKVIGKMKEGNEWGRCDIIEFYDALNCSLVLAIGTDNTDDYYPYCVMNWLPQNLSINQK